METPDVYRKRLIYAKIIEMGETVKILKDVNGVIKFKKIQNEWKQIGE